jgi:hypothetical protein
MTIRSQESRETPGVRATVRFIRLILRRSDLFPSACTLSQFWRGRASSNLDYEPAIARPTSGRSALCARGSILCSVGKDRPRNTCMFGGQCHSDDVHMPTLFQSSRPITLGVRLFVDNP